MTSEMIVPNSMPDMNPTTANTGGFIMTAVIFCVGGRIKTSQAWTGQNQPP